MGGGNGQKAAMARQKNAEKAAKLSKGGGSQLKTNEAAKTIQCKVCLQAFICTTTAAKLKEHWENRHPKSDIKTCFPDMPAE